MATILDFPGSYIRTTDEDDKPGSDREASASLELTTTSSATSNMVTNTAEIIIFTGTRIERIDTSKDKDQIPSILDRDQRNRLA